MKTFNFCKRTISLILSVMMLMSMFTVGIVTTSAAEVDTVETGVTLTGGEVLYLKPNSNWKSAGARFAAYFCNGTSTAQWVNANKLTDDIYYVTVPANKNHKNIIWCRMNPATADNNFNEGVKWNQTSDLTYDGTKNQYNISGWDGGSWDNTPYTPTTFSEGSFIHLKPGTAHWDKDNAWYAAYFFDMLGREPEKFVTGVSCSDGTHYGAYAPAGDYTHVIWIRMNPAATELSFDNKWDQTPDIYAGEIDNKCCVITAHGPDNGTATYSIEECSCDGTTGDEIRVYFRDDRKNLQYINLYSAFDAKMFVQSGFHYYEMTETVDVNTGHAMWYADVPSSDDMIFFRTSYFFDEESVSQKPWGKWKALDRGDKTVYCVTGNASSSTGSWTTNSVTVPDTSDIKNYDFGVWVDTRGEKNTSHAVKAYRTDFNSTEFNLYLPSYVDMDNVKVYTSFYELYISGGAYGTAKKVYKNAPNTLKLENGVTYTLTAKRTSGDSQNTYTLNVYATENTASLLMLTEEELYTDITYDGNNQYGIGTSTAWPIGSGITDKTYTGEYKSNAETKGTFAAFAEDGTEILGKNDKIKKIKGRGNSSWEASMKIFGKYAYNITFDKKVAMVEGATAAKKWSMLANNVDATMLRNTLIYSIADDIGLYYSPKTRIMDVYDNGKYLGAYIMAEKVEYGEDTVMGDLNNLDDRNEEYNVELFGDEDVMDYMEATAQNTDTFGAGTSYTYQYCTVDEDGAALGYTFETPDDYQDYNFLLEHELYDRYEAELSWFKSSRTGQAVVVKYPEVATKAEMEWIIEQYEAMEAAVYDSTTTLADLEALIDVEAFAKMYLIQELTQNLDSGATSYYIHNRFNEDGTSVLATSPVWDYDWAAGSYARGSFGAYDSGEKKAMFNGTSGYNYANVGDPDAYMFVKNKALKTTGEGETTVSFVKNYNLQAKLAHNADFWAVCQEIWTNNMVRVLYDYLDNDTNTDSGAADDDSVLLAEYMPAFASAVKMNDARWGGVAGNDNDNWGTKDTDDYVRGSMNFKETSLLTSGGAPSSYENTVYYLNDWLVTRMNYMSGTGGLYVDEMRYDINSVDFTGELVGDQLTITPAIDAVLNEVPLDPEAVEYTVYIDGKAVGTFSYADEAATVTFPAGTHSVYILATLVDFDDLTKGSAAQSFTYVADGGTINIDVYFKSSSSYHYIPSVNVDGVTYEMTIEGDAIAYNNSQTQGYYWYKASVPMTLGGYETLTFSNLTGMYAKVNITDIENKAYYFGADNLNNSETAVDLTFYNTEELEYIRNFVKSATHMVYNDYYDGGIATTSIKGNIYTLGDTDGDDTVSILDVTKMQYALAEIAPLSDTGKALADYDLDGTNSIADATAIQVYLVNN